MPTQEQQDNNDNGTQWYQSPWGNSCIMKFMYYDSNTEKHNKEDTYNQKNN